MKKVVEKQFSKFLKTRTFSIWDFLEPLLVLPLVYSVINFFQGVNIVSVLIAVAAFAIYLPIILAVFKRRRK